MNEKVRRVFTLYEIVLQPGMTGSRLDCLQSTGRT